MIGPFWSTRRDRGRAEDSLDLVYRIVGAGAEQRWVRVRAVAEVGQDGTVIRYAGTVMDDTERVKAEAVRRAAETRFEVAFEQSEIGAVIADLDESRCASTTRSARWSVDRRTCWSGVVG